MKQHKILVSAFFNGGTEMSHYYSFKCEGKAIELKPVMSVNDYIELYELSSWACLFIEGNTAEITYQANALSFAREFKLNAHYVKLMEKLKYTLGYKNNFDLNKHCPQCGDLVLVFDLELLSSLFKLGGNEGMKAFFKQMGFEFNYKDY